MFSEEEFELKRLLDDYETNMETAQKLADDSTMERHFSLLDTLCGQLSVQTLWKMLYVCQYQKTVEEELTLLSLVTESVTYSDQLPDSPANYCRILTQLAAVWESRIQVAKNELTDPSFTGVVRMLDRCAKQIDKTTLPPCFHKVLIVAHWLHQVGRDRPQLRHENLESSCAILNQDIENLQLGTESQPDDENIKQRIEEVGNMNGEIKPDDENCQQNNDDSHKRHGKAHPNDENSPKKTDDIHTGHGEVQPDCENIQKRIVDDQTVHAVVQTNCAKVHTNHSRLQMKHENFQQRIEVSNTEHGDVKPDDENTQQRIQDVHTEHGKVLHYPETLLYHHPLSRYPAFPPSAVVPRHTIKKLLAMGTESSNISQLLKKPVQPKPALRELDICLTKIPFRHPCLVKTTIMSKKRGLSEKTNYPEDIPQKKKSCMKTLDFYFQKQDIEKENIALQ